MTSSKGGRPPLPGGADKITVRVSRATGDWLRAEADRRGVKVAEVVRDVLSRHVKRRSK